MAKRRTHSEIVALESRIPSEGHKIDIESKRNMKVVKSNELIQQSRYTLSLQEQRIILYIVSMLKPDDVQGRISFIINDFIEVCGLSKSGNLVKDVKAAIKNLGDNSFWIKRSNGEETLVRWIDKPVISSDKKSFSVSIDADLKPYLIKLKKLYTSYELINVLPMGSKYAIRLYEILRSYLNQRGHTFKVDELKLMLCAEADKRDTTRYIVPKSYEAYSKFNQAILQPALKDIAEFTDIAVTMIPIRNGKKVEQLKFIVSSVMEESPDEAMLRYNRANEKLNNRE